MISIFALKSGKLIRNVTSLDGEDMRGRGSTNCPADFERMRWDKATRQWVACSVTAAAQRERATDGTYLAERGADSINDARRRLAIEASLWAAFSNETACPMLAAEAKMRGVPIDELADTIRGHDRTWIEREIARKQQKMEPQ